MYGNDWLLGICFVLIIILIVCIVIAANYNRKYNLCTASTSSWCYPDWQCLDPNNAKNSINMSELVLFGQAGQINRCNPLTADTLKKFTYSDGVNTYTK